MLWRGLGLYNIITMKLAGKIEKKIIYMDFAATTPMPREVVKVMEPFWSGNFGNPSSIHSTGREAKYQMDEARSNIAEILGAKEQEIYFTSGGTEGDNLAILGLARNVKCQMSNVKSNSNDKIIKPTTNLPVGRQGYQLPATNVSKGHIITTCLEHQAVLKTFQNLEKEGFGVTYLPVDKDGLITVEQVERAILPETVLVSVIYVSNEFGTVQPIKEIGKMLKKISDDRKQRIYFHTDAVQAPEYYNVNVLKLNVDMMSLSAHKFGGPKGVGILYIKKDVPIVPMVFGGEQELSLRSGTENVPGIVGMAKALEIVTQDCNSGGDKIVLEKKKYFEGKLKSEIGDIRIIGEDVLRSPGISSVVFADVDPVAVVMNLDLAGVCVSSGAACSSGSIEKSHAFESLNFEKPYDLGAVRFCFNKKLIDNELDEVIEKLKLIISRLREN